MRLSLRHVLTVVTTLSMAACGGSGPKTPGGPSPTPLPLPSPVTANAFILPGAVALGHFAFGDEPVVIYKGERLRWINADTLTHVVVADSPDRTDFRKTEELASGGEESFNMSKLGTTNIHCAIHPNMTGILIVRER